MVRRLLRGALVAAMLVALPTPPAAAAKGGVRLDDPVGDDRGPGTYLPPSNAYVHPGDFDLRRFELRVQGDEAVFLVTLGRRVRRHVVTQRQGAADLDLPTDLVVQNLDIYLDTTRGEGFTEALPGRRVRFPDAQGWDTAVVLSPQPRKLKALLRKAWPEADPRILVPYQVRALGDTVEARLPLAALGGPPQPHWGYSVLVTGAVWDRSFEALDVLTGAYAEHGFVMPVYGVPEQDAFGGARPGGTHPWVIDVLLPEGTSQARVLGEHGPEQPAVVPLVYPGGDAPSREATAPAASVAAATVAGGPADRPSAAAAVSAAPVTGPPRVTDLDGETVVVARPAGASELNAFQLGHVLNEEGAVVARFVVTHVADTFVVGQVVEGRDQIRTGARVRFDSNRDSKETP